MGTEDIHLVAPNCRSTLCFDLDPIDVIFHEGDVVEQIGLIQKPGDVAQWWKAQVTSNRLDWCHPLSDWEQEYIRCFRDPSVPEPLRVHDAASPETLTHSEVERANELFPGKNAAELFANYESRRRIVAHYVFTHPATIRLELGLYRFARDVNPIHFALERGWQMGSGREMFTQEPVSRLGAAAEFFASLAMGWGIGRALRVARATSPRPTQGLIADDARYAQTTYRNKFSGQEGARFAGWKVDQAADFLRRGVLHPRHVPIDFVVRDGHVLILNTRSAQALTQAGIPRSQWFGIN